MIFAGIDIGSTTSKAVVIEDGKKLIGHGYTPTGAESAKTAQKTLNIALLNAGVKQEDLSYIVATGYGRILVPFADKNISEISCHARGAHWYFPTVRTILDMGGQDCKAIKCTPDGNVGQFMMNDKCAGGTGRFLEIIADSLHLHLDKIGDIALQSDGKIIFNTFCTVFAKSVALNMVKSGVQKMDILAGLNEALAKRCHHLLGRVGIEPDFAITGGISKNKDLVKRIEEKVGLKTLLAPDPQLIGAIGAAIFASTMRR